MNGLYEQFRIAVHAIWHRRWLALAVAWGICVLGWLMVALIPNAYEADARVYVQMQSLLPDKIGITAVERQRDIDRVRQTLASSVNLEKVVRGTDLGAQAAGSGDVAGMVEALRQNITVTAQQDNLFQIKAKVSANGLSDAANAKLARDVVQKLIDIFVEENLRGDRAETSQTIRFLDQQLTSRERALRDAEAKRIAFETKFMGGLPGTGSIEQRMETARSELVQLEQTLASAQGALAGINGQVASTPASISTPGMAPVAVGGAAGRIAALEGQLSDAAARGWTDQHPDVIATKNQIARLRSQAAAEPMGGGGAYSSPNPMFATLRAMQAEKQATVSALAGRKAQLEGEMRLFAEKQAAEPGVAAEQTRLSGDYQVLKQQYDKLAADREDVKLRSDVATKTDSIQFRVIDPPSVPHVPVAPNRPLLLTAVLIAALGAGVGAAFAQSRLRTTFTTARQLEAASGLPVIGSVTRVWTAPEKEAHRKRLTWFAGGAGGLAACWALLMAVEFVRRGMMA